MPTQVKTARIFENINRTLSNCPMMVHGMPGRSWRENGRWKNVRWPVSRVLYPCGRWPFIWDVRYRTPRATNPGGDPETGLPANRPMPPLFGFAPGGVCRAASVTGRAVRSYRTVSPLPGRPKPRPGGLFSVALSLGSPPPAVSRHRDSVEPGLSSAPKDSGHPAI